MAHVRFEGRGRANSLLDGVIWFDVRVRRLTSKHHDIVTLATMKQDNADEDMFWRNTSPEPLE